ncbi:MAG TPA: SgcJ/EcaC family oxidoreductase [Kaistia sp.]|nr:SgcJ/EcaC family oxidoreductase [Kaistia sp.]
MSETSTIERFVEQWVAAFNSRDLDAHMALYTEDALLFGSVDVLHVGRAAVRTYFAERPPGVHVARYPMPTVLQLAPDVVATAGHVDFADGDDPMPYRMTWMLVRRAGDWQIAQHHGSPRLGN